MVVLENHTDDHKEYMDHCITENPKITLKELTEKLKIDMDLHLSKECVRKHLDGLMFTLKDVRREPEKANAEVNKIKRRDYVVKLLDFQSKAIPILYMDETNFNLFISRTKGRSKKGTRCTQISAGSKGSNVHVIGCMGNMGLLHHELRSESFKKPQPQEFV